MAGVAIAFSRGSTSLVIVPDSTSPVDFRRYATYMARSSVALVSALRPLRVGPPRYVQLRTPRPDLVCSPTGAHPYDRASGGRRLGDPRERLLPDLGPRDRRRHHRAD